MSLRKRVLILCTGNSARSQMAEGLLRSLGGEKVQVFSAGIDPSFLRPEAIEVMAEAGIDISKQRSKSVTEFANESFDYVITVCDHANAHCPIFSGAVKRLHWSIEDPAGFSGKPATEKFRAARDELQNRIKAFVASELASE